MSSQSVQIHSFNVGSVETSQYKAFRARREYWLIYDYVRTVNNDTIYPIGTTQSFIDDNHSWACFALTADYTHDPERVKRVIHNYLHHHKISGDLSDLLKELGYYNE